MSYRFYCRTEGGGEVGAITVQGRKRAEVVLFQSNDVLTPNRIPYVCLTSLAYVTVKQTVTSCTRIKMDDWCFNFTRDSQASFPLLGSLRPQHMLPG